MAPRAAPRLTTTSRDELRAGGYRIVTFDTRALTALAIAPDGSVAGFSDVRVSAAGPRGSYNGVTLIDPEHRGHRLGLAVKIATHDLALASFDSLETVATSNAEVNSQMVAVNEALGYRTTATALELQKEIWVRACAGVRNAPNGRRPCGAPGWRGHESGRRSRSGSGR